MIVTIMISNNLLILSTFHCTGTFHSTQYVFLHLWQEETPMNVQMPGNVAIEEKFLNVFLRTRKKEVFLPTARHVDRDGGGCI